MWPFKSYRKKRNPRDKPAQVPELVSRVRPRADGTLQGSELIYAAVSRISNTIAMMPMHLYKGLVLQQDHPLERLVALEPGPNYTAYGFRQTMEVTRNTEGNAYALIVRDGLGQVQRLDILDPNRVQIQRAKDTGEVWYVIRLDDGKQYPLPGWMVINLRHLSANGEKGIRPLDVLRGALDYDHQTKELSLDQLDGVNRGIMLTVPNTGLDDSRKQGLINSFLSAYEKSNRSVVLLEGGLTATTFSSDAVDSKLLDVERITRNRVATVYNIPPHLLGDYSNTNYATAEQQMQEFLQLTILPIVTQWEDEFNRKLLLPQDYEAGYRFRFDETALRRADMSTTTTRFSAGIRGGWITVNEARAYDGMPPDPHGDELMIARDLIPLRVSVEQTDLLLTGALSASQAAPKEEDDT